MDVVLLLNHIKSEIMTAGGIDEVSSKISVLRADFGKCVGYPSEAMISISKALGMTLREELTRCRELILDFPLVSQSLDVGSFDSHA